MGLGGRFSPRGIIVLDGGISKPQHLQLAQ